jgi:class 3 adenylate cyclase
MTSDPKRAELPEGTVTFLFTDIEGSTARLEALGEQVSVALAEQRRLMSSTYFAYRGQELLSEKPAVLILDERSDGINQVNRGWQFLKKELCAEPQSVCNGFLNNIMNRKIKSNSARWNGRLR